MASVSIYLFYFFTKETSVILYSFTLAKEVNIQIFKSSQKFWSFELSSVQVTWMLIYRIFIDSVVSTHSNSSFAPVKYKNDHYLLKKENRKVTSTVNFILVNLCSLPKQSLDSSVHWGNRGDRVVRSVWQGNLIFSLTFIKTHLILIQINMHCKWIEQGETSEFKTFEKIGVLLTRAYW